MRLAIISDIHANLEALQASLDAISAQQVERTICLGDIVGYNANPRECIALLREAGIACVAGNHDRAVTGQIGTDGFVETAVRAVAWTRERLDAEEIAFLAGLPLELRVGDEVLAVHGALLPHGGCETTRLDTDERRLASFLALSAHPSGIRICAFGHTHQHGVHEFRDGAVLARPGDQVKLDPGAHYLLNPGTIGQPRSSEWRATYMILDTEERNVSLHRVAYDRSTALAKTRRAGLLPPGSGSETPLDILRRSVLARRLYRRMKGIAALCRGHGS